jgi:glycosyltransferase involved in cell wall biosynthesis
MTRAERIAFVVPRWSREGTVGGAENLLGSLARRAAAQRDVEVLTTCARNHFTWANEREPGSETVDGLTVRYFRVNEDRDLERFLDVQEQISHGVEISDEEERDWIDHNVNSRDLLDHLTDSTYDTVVIGPYLFGLTWHASGIHPGRTFLVPCLHAEPFAQLRIMHRMFAQVRGFLFNSVPERELARRLFGLRDARIGVVGMGLESFEADAGAFARRHNLTQPYVIYSGRREPLKGTPMLLDFVHGFRRRTRIDLKLVLTGSGEFDAPAGLRPHIIDAGILPEKEKQEAMAGAVAFLHPSVNESLSIVILEAWLAGTPCLVTAFSDVMQYQCLQSGGGLWFQTYPEFEEQLNRLIQDTELRATLARRGRAFVRQQYNWNAVEKRFYDVIDGGR